MYFYYATLNLFCDIGFSFFAALWNPFSSISLSIRLHLRFT